MVFESELRQLLLPIRRKQWDILGRLRACLARRGILPRSGFRPVDLRAPPPGALETRGHDSLSAPADHGPQGPEGHGRTRHPRGRSGPGQDHRGRPDHQGVHPPRPGPPLPDPGPGLSLPAVVRGTSGKIRPRRHGGQAFLRIQPLRLRGRLPGHGQTAGQPGGDPGTPLRSAGRGRSAQAEECRHPELAVRQRPAQAVLPADHGHAAPERPEGALQPNHPAPAGATRHLPLLQAAFRRGQAPAEERRRAQAAPERR